MFVFFHWNCRLNRLKFDSLMTSIWTIGFRRRFVVAFARLSIARQNAKAITGQVTRLNAREFHRRKRLIGKLKYIMHKQGLKTSLRFNSIIVYSVAQLLLKSFYVVLWFLRLRWDKFRFFRFHRDRSWKMLRSLKRQDRLSPDGILFKTSSNKIRITLELDTVHRFPTSTIR